MGLYINIEGLNGEDSITTFRLLVSEEMLTQEQNQNNSDNQDASV